MEAIIMRTGTSGKLTSFRTILRSRTASSAVSETPSTDLRTKRMQTTNWTQMSNTTKMVRI